MMLPQLFCESPTLSGYFLNNHAFLTVSGWLTHLTLEDDPPLTFGQGRLAA